MSLETFLGTTTGVIAALTGLVGALIALFKLIIEFLKLNSTVTTTVTEPPPGQAALPAPREHRRREWPFFTAILLLQVLVVATSAAVGRFAFPPAGAAAAASPPPQVEITSPLPEQPVEVRLSAEGSGAFFVSGRSSGVADDPDRRLYVLVHPVEPWAAGWWVQNQAAVDARSGEWTSRSWYGDRNFTPAPGHRLQVVAVVARPFAAVPTAPVADPKDLRPLAQSGAVTITVGAARRE